MTDDEDDDDERTAPILQVVDFNALNAALGDAPPSPPPPPSAPSPPGIGESQGRTNATYASRPRPVPQTRAPQMDPDTPAVIIQTDDTAPTGPPIQMTVPMAGAPPIGSRGIGEPPTVRGRPGLPPNVTLTKTRVRRPKSPTMIVRPRGPTTLQKVIVFLSLLFVFVAGGVAYLLHVNASLFGIEPASRSAPAP